MRFGELVGVQWKHVDLDKRTIYLPDSKNGEARTVPMSTRAVTAIQILPRSISGCVFTGKPGSIRTAFLVAVQKAKACSPEGILQNLRFHDLRHEGVSRLFEKGLNPIEVGMVSGHKTLSMLKRYTHLKSEDLVKKIT